MNILIVFATNSGSTLAAVQVLQQELQNRQHQITVKNVLETQPSDFNTFELIILASPSWDYKGEEGMPHEHYQQLFTAFEQQSFPQKSFAIVGLGDSNYTFFCGAVTHLEAWVAKLQGTLMIPSLKLDQYYFNVDTCDNEIVAWAQKI